MSQFPCGFLVARERGWRLQHKGGICSTIDADDELVEVTVSRVYRRGTAGFEAVRRAAEVDPERVCAEAGLAG
jgi:hypothetical protein